MIDREPPNADKRRAQASERRFCATSRAGSSPPSLASRAETAHSRPSGAGIRGISALKRRDLPTKRQKIGECPVHCGAPREFHTAIEAPWP